MLEDVDSLNPDVAPWTLTCVCHGWRELVISSPLLWTYFHFNADKPVRSLKRQKCAERTRLYLERSGNLPLSIHLVDAMAQTADHPVFPSLKLAMSRCKRLAIEVSTVILQALSGTVFSHLSLLAVGSAYMTYTTAHVDTFNAVSAPNLRTVICHDAEWDSMRFVSVPVPWSQVTEVHHLPIFDDVSLQWLQDIPHVTTLGVIVLRSSFIPLDTMISLPEVDDFTLAEAEDAQPGGLKEFMSPQ
ncbi:hypothetical protein BDZ89DRAFT_1139665 [Hymenopellis radicata]|nr:hypothetical protein BDZ89DRAFT_1139665 [Hymenopellis radicata]